MQEFACGLLYCVRRDAQFLIYLLVGRGRTEAIQADDAPGVAHPFVPAHRRRRFDGYARLDLRRQYAVTVGLVLLFEQFPAWHTDHARLDTRFCQVVTRL